MRVVPVSVLLLVPRRGGGGTSAPGAGWGLGVRRLQLYEDGAEHAQVYSDFFTSRERAMEDQSFDSPRMAGINQGRAVQAEGGACIRATSSSHAEHSPYPWSSPGSSAVLSHLEQAGASTSGGFV
jgi:hypothetical protein